MTHARQQIRVAIATLVTGLTTTGANVFPSRVHPLQDTDLPGLTVYTTTEDVETDTMMMGTPLAREQHRSLNVVVESYVKATANFDNILDTIAVEVEKAILADPTLGGLAKDTVLSNTEISLLSEGDKPVALATFTFLTQYRVSEIDPETLL